MIMGRARLLSVFVYLICIVSLICVVEFVRVTFFPSHRGYIQVVSNTCRSTHQRKGSLTEEFNTMSTKGRSSSISQVTTTKQESKASSSKTDNFIERHEKTQQQRTAHVQRICQTYHHESRDVKELLGSSHEKRTGAFLVDDKYKILHCNTPKIAGTSWKRVFNVLAGLKNSTSEGNGYENVDLARNIRRLVSYTPTEIDHILKTYTKFMFARHPFSRLLSAFNNKLAPNATDVRNKQEFRDAVGEIIQLAFHPCIYERQRRKKCEYDVTFHDFVRFLNDPRMEPFQGNIHWMSNYDLCYPCDIKYDIIGKYETLADDAKYVLKAVKVDHLVSFPSNEGNAATSTHSSSQKKLISAYKYLSMNEIEALVRRFRMDFLLYDYPIVSSEEFARILGIKRTQ